MRRITTNHDKSQQWTCFPIWRYFRRVMPYPVEREYPVRAVSPRTRLLQREGAFTLRHFSLGFWKCLSKLGISSLFRVLRAVKSKLTANPDGALLIHLHIPAHRFSHKRCRF